MGFFDSLGIQFIDDAIEEDEEDTSQELQPQQKQAPSKSSSKLSTYTKEDLIVFLLILFIGAALGYAYSRMIAKKDKSEAIPMPYPMFSMPMHYDYPREHTREEKHRATDTVPLHKQKPRRASRRYGYYSDENGDLLLDPPTVREQWVIDTDSNGDIIDARQIPDMTEVF